MSQSSMVMSAEGVAQELNIARGTAYDLVHSQGFPVVKIGRCWGIPRQAFEKWLDVQATAKAL
jgi:excisionase family DNA binding protein